MRLPRGSLGFLNDKAERPRGAGRIRDRLRLGCPDGGQSVPLFQGNGRDSQSYAQPLSHTEHSPPAHTASTGHVPRRRHRGADVSDELSVDHRAGAL